MYRVLRGGMLLCLVAVLASCTRPPDLIGVLNAEIPMREAVETTRQKVFVATTRQASDELGVFYSGERSPTMSLASVVVSIPPNHQPGFIERPNSLPPNPQREFAVIEPTKYRNAPSFIHAINAELARRAPEDRDLLLFVHGYNNTFSDAVLLLAQFVEDTGYTGVPVLFSWASAGKASQYVYDLNSALAAREPLVETGRILGRTSTYGFDLFAHSMGALLTMEALVEINNEQGRPDEERLNSVMMAAPDIDLDLFRTQLKRLPFQGEDLFLFISKDDVPLRVARRISGGIDRVGTSDAAELSELGVTVIDISGVADEAYGTHSKFAGSPEVVELIGESLGRDHLVDNALSRNVPLTIE